MLFKQAPLFNLILPFLTGILIYYYFPTNYQWLLWSEIVLCMVFLIVHLLKMFNYLKFNNLYTVLTFLSVFGFGYLVTQYSTSSNNIKYYSNFLKENNKITVQLVEPIVVKQKSIKVVGNILQVDTKATTGKVLLYLEPEERSLGLNYGDVILFDAGLKEITPPKNIGEFDYKSLMNIRQINYQTYLASVDWQLINKNENVSFKKLAIQIRNKLQHIFIENGLRGNELGVAEALILGAKDDIDENVKNDYATSGASHVLAVSGLHVGIIYIVLSNLLLFFKKIKGGEFYRATILLTVLWFYAMISGLSPSVLRASTMFSFVIIGGLLGRNTNIYNTLAASAFFLLIIDPYLLFEVGFLLSYIAVIGIVYFQPRLYSLYDPLNKLVDYLWQLTTVSIAAQIATFPLTLYYFHQFPIYFLLSNIVVIPFATLIIYNGILIFVISAFPLFSMWLTKFLSGVISFMNLSIEFISNLPFSVITSISISFAEMLIIYLIIGLLILYLNFRKGYIFISFLSTILALTGYNIYEKGCQLNQKQLVLYNSNKGLVVDLIEGDQCYSYSNFGNSEQNINSDFWTENYRMICGVDQVEDISNENSKYQEGSILKQGNFVQFGNKRIFLLKSEYDLINLKETKIEIDYLIISSLKYIDIELISRYFDFRTIVIASMSHKIAEKYKNESKAIIQDKMIMFEF